MTPAITLLLSVVSLLVCLTGAVFLWQRSSDNTLPVPANELQTVGTSAPRIAIWLGGPVLFIVAVYSVSQYEDSFTPYTLTVRVVNAKKSNDITSRMFEYTKVTANSKEGIQSGNEDEFHFQFEPSEMPPNKQVLIVADDSFGDQKTTRVYFDDEKRKSVDIVLDEPKYRIIPVPKHR
jgi:hypothetical protein